MIDEPKSTGDELTEETEGNLGWELALALNHELNRAKNDLEKALLDADSHPALRRRVREVHSNLVATVKAYAQYLKTDHDEAEEEGQARA